VWLKDDGSCANGHAAASISSSYEVAPAPPGPMIPAPPVPAKKGRPGLVIGIVVGVLAVLFICGILSAIAVPVFLNASGNAQQKSCFANQRVVAGAVQVYLATNEGATPPEDWQQAEALIVPGVIKKMPTCPGGGTYSLDSTVDGTTEVSCSLHGVVTEGSAP
jgi:competence protein ComGC